MTVRGGAGPRDGDEHARLRTPMARPIRRWDESLRPEAGSDGSHLREDAALVPPAAGEAGTSLRAAGVPTDRPAGVAMEHVADAHPRAGGAPGAGGAARARRRNPPRAGTVSALDLANGRSGPGLGGLLRVVLFLAVGAALVLVLLTTVLRPIARGIVVDLAGNNPGALGIPFVADFVREDLGDKLTAPASSDATEVEFAVSSGESAAGIAQRLAGVGLLRDPRAFLLIAIDRGLEGQLETGTFLLRRNLTPDQLVTALLQAVDLSIVVQLRPGLRVEQVAAYLEARPAEIATLQMKAADFLALARNPPASLLADYPWLQLPKGTSLEGYLAGGSYRILPDTTPEELIRKMLDHFAANVGSERLAAATQGGRTLEEVVTLASLVDKETSDDAERAKIAGVFENRMNARNETAGFLGSDPSVFYVNDSLHLAAQPIQTWPTYSFWTPPADPLPKDLPADLAGYNTYTSKGLPPGPICTPSVASIDAALAPDTQGGYLYFLATKDGTTVFAKTYAEHQKNIKKYGGG